MDTIVITKSAAAYTVRWKDHIIASFTTGTLQLRLMGKMVNALSYDVLADDIVVDCGSAEANDKVAAAVNLFTARLKEDV